MNKLQMLRHGATLLRDHPGLVHWFLRNKLRTLTLGYEQKYLNGTSRFARGITFRLTSTCNLRCKMCRFAESGAVTNGLDNILPMETWIDVLDDLAPYKPYITLTGGEPLVYPHIDKLLVEIKKRGLRCTVTTNGVMLANHAQAFVDSEPDLVIVSLDGPPEVHNEVRGLPNAFERAVEGIRAVQELSKAAGRKRPVLVINCSITAYNYQHVEKMIDIARGIGVHALNFQHQWTLTQRMVDDHNQNYSSFWCLSGEELGVAEHPKVDLDAITIVLQRIRQRARDIDDFIIISHPELSDDEVREWYADPHNWVQRKPAVCAWINTQIEPNGDVVPCFGMSCGNVKDTSFSKIWNGQRYKDFRKHLAKVGDLPVCVRCCAYFRRD